MPLKEREGLIEKIEQLRNGRRLVAICNFDRPESPNLGALSTQYHENLKEPLYRVLKETVRRGEKLDVFLYTRGGATNAVWPVACLLREFDPDFEVLIPFRAHSSGTLLSLAAARITMTPLAELSPIDPTTANQFNPRDPTNQASTLGIAVEDVSAYQEFWRQAYELGHDGISPEVKQRLLQPHFLSLSSQVHPLALGGVHRVYMQIRALAQMLLERNYGKGKNVTQIIDQLTTRSYSHHHMIHRTEAKRILGTKHVSFGTTRLSTALDRLLRQYEDDFDLRRPFFLGRYMGNDAEKEPRFIGGCVESCGRSYLFETRMKIRQYAVPPSGIQVQVQPGQPIPLIPGIPRRIEWEMTAQAWIHNTTPQGVTT